MGSRAEVFFLSEEVMMLYPSVSGANIIPIVIDGISYTTPIVFV